MAAGAKQGRRRKIHMTRASILILISAALLSACGAQNGAVPPGSNVSSDAQQTGHGTYKIYVANIGNGTITTYDPNGTQIRPTITTGNYLYAIAVAPTGKIYAVTYDSLSSDKTGEIASYRADGHRTSPTILFKETGYSTPSGIAVDSNGKIYLLNSGYDGLRGKVTTYTPQGRRTTPTFRTGPDSSNIAIDANGKIFVTNDTGPRGQSSVTTYLPDGTQTKPTITNQIHRPSAVTVAADGMIYVANTNNSGRDGTEAGYVTSYDANGKGPHQRTRDGQGPSAILAYGLRVYLASSNAYQDSIRTYTLDGRRTNPTIVEGLNEPSSIAIY